MKIESTSQISPKSNGVFLGNNAGSHRIEQNSMSEDLRLVRYGSRIRWRLVARIHQYKCEKGQTLLRKRQNVWKHPGTYHNELKYRVIMRHQIYK
jgi:hypothetical protein